MRFSCFEHIWTLDKQAKVFSNLVSISPRYLITKFEKFDSPVCMTHRSQNFRLSKLKKISFILFSFTTDVFTPKFFLLMVPFKATRDSQRYRFLLRGVHFDSPV